MDGKGVGDKTINLVDTHTNKHTQHTQNIHTRETEREPAIASGEREKGGEEGRQDRVKAEKSSG